MLLLIEVKHLPGPERASVKPALTSESTNVVRPLFVNTVGMLPWIESEQNNYQHSANQIRNKITSPYYQWELSFTSGVN